MRNGLHHTKYPVDYITQTEQQTPFFLSKPIKVWWSTSLEDQRQRLACVWTLSKNERGSSPLSWHRSGSFYSNKQCMRCETKRSWIVWVMQIMGCHLARLFILLIRNLVIVTCIQVKPHKKNTLMWKFHYTKDKETQKPFKSKLYLRFFKVWLLQRNKHWKTHLLCLGGLCDEASAMTVDEEAIWRWSHTHTLGLLLTRLAQKRSVCTTLHL